MSETVISSRNVRLKRSQDALATQVDSETMLLVLSTGMYHSLSGVGARIWELLDTPATSDEMSVLIANEYGVPLDQCREDTASFFESLSRAGAIEAV